MEKLELREASFGECLFSSIIYSAWLLFSACGTYFFLIFPEYNPAPWFLPLVLLLNSPFVILGIIGLKKTIISYHTRLVISKDEITLYRGRRMQRVPLSQVSEYGCAGFVYRSSFLFFCTVPKDEIADYADENMHNAEYLFGEERVRKMLSTHLGQWQLKVGIFVYYAAKMRSEGHILIFSNGRPQYLQAVSKYMDTLPMLTGPVLYDNPKPWMINR